jgi:hypothetical protein
VASFVSLLPVVLVASTELSICSSAPSAASTPQTVATSIPVPEEHTIVSVNRKKEHNLLTILTCYETTVAGLDAHIFAAI